MVLTLHKVAQEFGPDSLRVSTVKNRGGRSDQSGTEFVELDFSGDTMTIKEPK